MNKPKVTTIYTCTLCGKVFTVQGHVNNCQHSHIDPKDLKIKMAKTDKEGNCYMEGERFPTTLEVWCEQTQRKVTYVLSGAVSSKRKEARQPPPIHLG